MGTEGCRDFDCWGFRKLQCSIISIVQPSLLFKQHNNQQMKVLRTHPELMMALLLSRKTVYIRGIKKHGIN